MGRRRCCCEQELPLNYTSASFSGSIDTVSSGNGVGKSTCSCCTAGIDAPNILIVTLNNIQAPAFGCSDCTLLNGTYYLTRGGFGGGTNSNCYWSYNIYPTINSCPDLGFYYHAIGVYWYCSYIMIILWNVITNKTVYWWDVGTTPPSRLCCDYAPLSLSNFRYGGLYRLGGTVACNFTNSSVTLQVPAC